MARLVQLTDKTAVSALASVAWRTVGAILQRVVALLGPKEQLDDLVGITVDETAFKRGHRYLTIVVNLETGAAVWAAKGKSAATLGRFFEALGSERCARLEVVAMDMNGGYEKAVKERCPNADVVYDRFHIVKLLLDAVDQIRRNECSQLTGVDQRELKHTRFALLRNPRHLRPSDHDAIARTIRKRLHAVLAFIRWSGITTAHSEGRNNKIKMLIHRAYGFHSAEAVLALITLCCSGMTI